MSLRIERADLLAALTATTKAVERRNTYPILANVLLSFANERLTVRGTDLDIEITTSVPAVGSLEATTAPAATLLDIVKKFPAGAEVTLELDGPTLLVKSGRSRFKLAVLAAESFPELKSGEFWPAFEVDLAALFAPVGFAQSDEETKFYLNGIYLVGDGKTLTAVATDAHRLAKHVVPLEGADFKGIIVPTKTVGVVPQGPIFVSVSDTKVRFEKGDTIITSKLIEGTFPDYERAIPTGNKRIAVANRTDLLAAVDRVGAVASASGGKALKFEAANQTITLTVRGDNDSASDEVAAEFDGEAVESGVSSRYLQDILGAISGASVTLAFGAEMGPILLRGDNDNWVGVQMPMRA